MPAPPTLLAMLAMDYVVPSMGAVVFVPVMSRVAEPARRILNAIFVAELAACT